tara:strand:- start:110 stop:301 length:192 start_codon:yes stop_codon:yes gene_type:complete
MSIVSEDLMNEEVHDQIKEWYELIDDPYFENKPWQHLYDEEKQIVAELYWDDMLNQDNQRKVK